MKHIQLSYSWTHEVLSNCMKQIPKTQIISDLKYINLLIYGLFKNSVNSSDYKLAIKRSKLNQNQHYPTKFYRSTELNLIEISQFEFCY
jgi:hypothetical protein